MNGHLLLANVVHVIVARVHDLLFFVSSGGKLC
jgi:hypothetical protein